MTKIRHSLGTLLLIASFPITYGAYIYISADPQGLERTTFQIVNRTFVEEVKGAKIRHNYKLYDYEIVFRIREGNEHYQLNTGDTVHANT